jgi:hypothetical protein
MPLCKGIGCHRATIVNKDLCHVCIPHNETFLTDLVSKKQEKKGMSSKYPKYYKDVGNLKEVDVYAVHMLFEVDDTSGAIQHASKKLLLSGVRTGGKSQYDDVREARDTLNRWLELQTPNK